MRESSHGIDEHGILIGGADGDTQTTLTQGHTRAIAHDYTLVAQPCVQPVGIGGGHE